MDLEKEANNYLSEEHELTETEDVLSGANDIIAEWVSDEAEYREYIRNHTFQHGQIVSVVKDETLDEKRVYEMRSEEHTSELQSRGHLVCRLLLDKKKE